MRLRCGKIVLKHSLHCYSKFPPPDMDAMRKLISTVLFASLLFILPILSPAQQSNDKCNRTQLKENIRTYSKAIALNPANAEAFYLRANTKYLLGDYKSAIADYNKAIDINPENRMAYYNRGFANTKLGNKIASRADFSKAAELGIRESADLDSEEPE